MKCCNKEMNSFMDFKFWRHDAGCGLCDSNGDMYLSDGVYTTCDCYHGYGHKVKFASCDICGLEVEDETRKVTSRRIRAHLRLLLIKRDKDIVNRLESLFCDSMSWSNRSEWHVDHIRPIKSFLDNGITDCNIINDPMNLQPLWAKDNLIKGAKYSG